MQRTVLDEGDQPSPFQLSGQLGKFTGIYSFHRIRSEPALENDMLSEIFYVIPSSSLDEFQKIGIPYPNLFVDLT